MNTYDDRETPLSEMGADTNPDVASQAIFKQATENTTNHYTITEWQPSPTEIGRHATANEWAANSQATSDRPNPSVEADEMSHGVISPPCIDEDRNTHHSPYPRPQYDARG